MNPQPTLSYMASSSFEALASTLLTNVVMKKWNMDYSYFGLVFACVYGGVEFLRAEIMTVNLKEWIYSLGYLHWGLLVIVYLAYVYHDRMFRMIFKIFPKKLLKLDTDYLTIRIYDVDKIRILLKYMEYFPEHFDSNYDIDVGDQQIQAQLFMDPSLPNNGQKLHEYMGLRMPTSDHRINIDDQSLKINGFLEFKDNKNSIQISTNNMSGSSASNNNSNNSSKIVNLKYVEIRLNKKSVPDNFDFLTEISDIVNTKEKDQIKLRFLKFFYNPPMMCGGLYGKLHISTMYEGPKHNLVERENQLIRSFFHPHRDQLWSYVKKIVEEPTFFRKYGQAPRVNFLFHGPPGSGKSTFAYRIAMATNRHIYSLDLREFRNKKDVYSVMGAPQLGHSSNDVSTPDKCIFVLEEFDTSVRYLYHQERRYNRRMRRWIDKISKDEDFEEPTEVKKKTEEESKSCIGYYVEEKTVNDLDRPNTEEFCLKDLLEIFQGAVPTDGSIIIATTNDFEGIKMMCPALFRPGRLTPIHFGYLDKETLQELSQYYFGRSIDIRTPDQLPIPTSQIVELALESAMQNNNDPYDHFRNGLLSLLH